MRFILVNGRTASRQSTCALCTKPIATNYLREIATRLPYCDADCYADHYVGTILALENHATATDAASPDRGNERSAPARGKSREGFEPKLETKRIGPNPGEARAIERQHGRRQRRPVQIPRDRRHGPAM
jgi:hypothetical protein